MQVMNRNIKLSAYLNKISKHYNQLSSPPPYLSYYYRQLIAQYYKRLIHHEHDILEIGSGQGLLLKLLSYKRMSGVDISETQVDIAKKKIPDGRFYCQAAEYLNLDGKFDVILISDTLNYVGDIQLLLQSLHSMSHSNTRLMINSVNTLWYPLINLANHLGLKNPEPPGNWLSVNDVLNLLNLSDWENVTIENRILMPLPVIGPILNRWIAPLLQHFCLTTFIVCRPRIPFYTRKEYSVTVIVPARNEAGNICSAVERIPVMGTRSEVIFIEGNSTDNTWEEIQKNLDKRNDLTVSSMKQTGKGKANAVREAIAKATGDVIMILDADLTVAPEDLPKFYELLATGKAEFANGVRLVYPMDNHAMRFLNMCANKFFSIGFSWILGQPVKDTLCGTKVFFRESYLDFAKDEADLRLKDPFGDFEFLYFARQKNLKILDIPIRYHDRVYGQTNINRWRHGWMLLKMLVYGALRFKFI